MRRRAIATLVHGASAVALTGIFAGALGTAVVLHADLPGTRRAAAEIGNRVLASLFDGHIVVGEVESLSLGRTSSLRARSVEITTPEGERVIHAEGVDGTIDVERLLRSIKAGTGVVIAIASAKVERADVVLDRAADGKPEIARTFQRTAPIVTPIVPTAPVTPKVAIPPWLDIASVRIDDAHVHGNLVPPSLDGDAHGVHGSLHLEKDYVSITVDEGKVSLASPHVPGQKAPIVGAVKGSLGIALANLDLVGTADLVGSCGAVPVVAHASIDKDQVEARIDVAPTEAVALDAAIGGLPFGRTVEAHAEAHGKLPEIVVAASARIGGSTLQGGGSIDLREGHAFRFDLDATHVDARAWGAPLTTDLTGKAHAEGVLGVGGTSVVGSFDVTTTEGSIESERIPAAVIGGRIEPKSITATVRAKEPGADLSGKLDLDLPATTVTFDLQGRTSSIRALTRVPNAINGSASARARGTLDLKTSTIKATTTMHADGLASGSFSARHLDATGRLTGPVVAPVLDVGFNGVDIALTAKNKTPLVYPTAAGRAQIAFVPSLQIRAATIDVGVKGTQNALSASIANISVEHGVIHARGVAVRGLGEPLELDVSAGDGRWNIHAKSTGVDLRRVAAMTGIKQLEVFPEGTRASLDVDVHDGGEGPTGHFDVVLKSEKGALLGGALTIESHGTLVSGHLDGRAKVSAEGLGEIEIASADLQLPNRLDARSLQRTTGTMELRGTIDLSQGAALVFGEHVERVAGIASFQARIERGDPDALPAVRATVETQGLEAVVVPGEPGSASTTIAGLDLLAHAEWDGRTEDAELTLLGWDRHGVLANVTTKTRAPLLAWATGAKKLDAAALAELDVSGYAEVVAREISDLPEFLGLPALRGQLAGHVSLDGKLAHPSVVLSTRAHGLQETKGRGKSANFAPLDGTLDARWDGEQASATFALDERVKKKRDTKAPGHLRGLALVTDVRMEDLLHGRRPSKLPWSASTEVEVENLTLAALPLPIRGVTGALSGRVRIKDFNRDASFEGTAQVADLAVSGATVERLDITVGGRDASLFAHASLTDQTSTATVQLASQALRVAGTDISWKSDAPTRLDYAVQNGRLALLAPLLKQSIAEIDGRVDGTGSVTLDAGTQVFEGGLAVRQTTLYVNALGEEITGLAATARFERSGTFRIDDAAGKMGSGDFKASASGKMNGFSFVEGQAVLIAASDGLPISSEGATFAQATGEVRVSAKMSDDRKELELTIDLPRSDVQLPDRGAQQLEPLEADKTVAIGVRKKGVLDTKAVRKGRGGTGKTKAAIVPIKATLTLGDQVHLEGRGLDVVLGGQTLIHLGEELTVTGQVALRSGTIEVHGRRFTVDRGVVTFLDGGDPGNPVVVAAAYWDAPDRTRVWVEFAGPLKSGNLTLRSEPAYSKNEILSVLLFGRPDPNMAAGTTDQTGDASGATAIGSGFVAEDLNRMLSELDDNLDIETDTLAGNRTRTKLGHSFFDRRLKVQVGYAPGTTYREPDATYLFLNWQFIPKWSLLATRGDKGTSILDVLFQHRY